MTIRAFIVILFVAASARAAEYSRRIWRIEDGLPQNRIQSLAQTPDGYLWIGTSGGLVRFDGARFAVFDRSNTPALGDDSIAALITARDGTLWIGTEGGGIARLRSGAFRSWGAVEGLTNGFVRIIAEDSSGRIWIGTDRGIFLFANERLTRLDGRNGVPILSARAIHQDRSGTVWIAANVGIYSAEGGRLSLSAKAWPVLGQITAAVETADNNLWFAGDTGLYRVQAGKPVLDKRLDGEPIRSLLEDRKGNLWIGTAARGLTRVSQGTLTEFHTPETLPEESVLSLFEDRENNLWVGTQDGLLRLTETTVRTLSSKQGLAEDNVITVNRDPAGAIWMSTGSGDLYRLQGGRPVLFAPPVTAGVFHPRNVYFGRDGAMWIGSATQGVLRLEMDGAGRTRGFSRFSRANGMRSNGARDFLEDRRGAVWIATGSGLSRWDHGSVRTFYLEDGLAYGSVRALALDANGDVLVGTDGGINRVRDGRFLADAVFRRLGNKRIWAILADAGGTLWLGTRGDGLVRIGGGRITQYTTHDGLPSNSIYQILDDGAGRLWMSSAAGVFSVRRSGLEAMAKGAAGPLEVVPFDTDEGMPTSQMNGGVQTAGCVAPDGELWFPSVKGAIRIDPRHLHMTPPAPVLIEAMMVDDRAVPLAAPISLAPGGNRLQIDFTSPSLTATDRVSFKYNLEGFDKAWIPSMKQRSVWFTNLPPRRYKFRVVAHDVSQPARASEADIVFDLEPHFYQTGWFYALMTALGALLVYAVFHFYARQTKARYALVLAERTRLAREMHDTLIQGCVGVSTLLEASRSMPDSAAEKSRDLVDRAATQIRITVNEARDAVWDLRRSGMDQGLTGTLFDFAAQVSASEGIPVHAEIEGSPEPVNENAGRNLLLVAREAVRNAVLHGDARQIRVKLHFERSTVRLEVSDNGKGFNVQKTHHDGHYGIIGMRERVEQSGGVFELRSFPGKGTSVIAQVPLGKQGAKHA